MTASLSRQKPRHGFARWVTWPVAFLLDRHGDPSTTKILIFAVVGAYLGNRPIPPLACVALLSASFGYSMWKDFLARGSWTAASTESLSVSHDVREIAERRNADRGYEPT